MRPVVNHIGVSGGKDSTALLLWAVHESDYDPATLDVTFCDTSNEHEITYDYVRMLSEKVHPITWLNMRAFMQATGRPDIMGFYELARWKQRFPGPRSRFCTDFLKIKPSLYHINALIALLGCDVVMHSGVRASESDERAKMVAREEERENVSIFRPLLKWSIDDVWAIHKKYGIEPNPLYAAGAQRVGCLPCIMSRKAEIANIATRWPERITMIGDVEKSKFASRDHPEGKEHGFFKYNTVPKRFRSRKITTSDGRTMNVCTIEDVVQWATEPPKIKPAAEFKNGDLFSDLDTRTEDKTACQSTWGSCE